MVQSYAFNKTQNQPRNSSTNARVLSARPLNNMSKGQIATNSAPVVTVGRAAAQPPPAPRYRDKWVLRTYQIDKATTSSTNDASLLASDIGPAVAGDLGFIDKISVWNTTPNAGISASLNQGTVTDSGITDPVTGLDWGSYNSLPGVTFKVPTGHAKAIDLHAATVLATATTLQQGTGTAYHYCFHVSLWVSI